MNRDDIQKLLGGYATGTLTPEERQALFEAALTDQELFDALAREEALRSVLSDPVARAHVLAAIDDVPAPWYRNWWRPMVVMGTAALLVVGVAVYTRGPKAPEMAKVELPRFRPPVAAPTQPILPEPPELRRESRALKSLPIPLPAVKPAPPPITPVAAPAPQPARDSALAKSDAATADGQISSGMPMQKQSPQPQARQFQSSQSQAPAGSQLQQLRVPVVPSASNAFLQSGSVPVRGTVTDATGAAVPAANVVVKSLATGETVNTATDAKGEFTAPEKPGSTYQISASAAGFKATTVSQVSPVTGTPEPVNLRLDVGAAAETVQVEANASLVPATGAAAATAVPATRTAAAGGGRGGRGGPAGVGGSLAAEMKKAKATTPSTIEYHLFRRLPGGDLAEVLADGTVPAGSSLILRVTPIADGTLRIVEGTRTIASPRVRSGIAHEITLPRFDKPGHVELRVYFSGQASESKDQAAPFVTIAFNIQ
jgi:hypothetical protein